MGKVDGPYCLGSTCFMLGIKAIVRSCCPNVRPPLVPETMQRRNDGKARWPGETGVSIRKYPTDYKEIEGREWMERLVETVPEAMLV